VPKDATIDKIVGKGAMFT